MQALSYPYQSTGDLQYINLLLCVQMLRHSSETRQEQPTIISEIIPYPSTPGTCFTKTVRARTAHISSQYGFLVYLLVVFVQEFTRYLRALSERAPVFLEMQLHDNDEVYTSDQ